MASRWRFSRTLFSLLVAVAMLMLSSVPTFAEIARIDPEGVPGTLVLCGGGRVPDSVVPFFLRQAGGNEAKLVVIPTASADVDLARPEKYLAPWKERAIASITLLHTRNRNLANDEKFIEPLRKATAVWFTAGSLSRIKDAYQGTKVEKELHALLRRDGVLGGSSGSAALFSKLAIESGKQLVTGFDLLPRTVIHAQFDSRKRTKRLLSVLVDRPGLVGVGIDENTALVVQGRSLRVLGDSTVTLALASGAEKSERTRDLTRRDHDDLTTWQRAAEARTHPPFPPKTFAVPGLSKGALVIAGGGRLPPTIMRTFIELAGGPQAPIVVLPIALPDPISVRAEKMIFRRAGAKNITVLTARRLEDVDDPKTLEILRNAKGIWMGGGRQWRLVDAYLGTKAQALFHDILQRGGVIGGSSAGASIQGEYLCRADPLGNHNISCEGYEQGFGLLAGVAIDQHFSQRDRLADMSTLKKCYPQLLGIGIDEGTALVVQGQVAKVVGRNKVLFYGQTPDASPDEPEYVVGRPGDLYELVERKLLGQGKNKGSDNGEGNLHR